MKRLLRRLLIALVVIAAMLAVANIPTTTDQGVDFVVTRHSLPLYLKALDFVDRDLHYRRLAAEVTDGANTDDQKARAVFDWTRAHIRSQPAGLPIVDDHIWHIIVRGYGASDQQADVFTTLLSYAGVPAYFIFIGPPPEVAMAFAKVGGAWRVADVASGVMFRSRQGAWATAEELAADPQWMAAQGPKTIHDLPYARFFDDFNPPVPPTLTRADTQVPGARTWFTIKGWFGSPGRQWEMRPSSRRKRAMAS